MNNNLDNVDFDWEYSRVVAVIFFRRNNHKDKHASPFAYWQLTPRASPKGLVSDWPKYLSFHKNMKLNIFFDESVVIAAPASYWYLESFPVKEMAESLNWCSVDASEMPSRATMPVKTPRFFNSGPRHIVVIPPSLLLTYLMEMASGFRINAIADHTPRECWQRIRGEAIQIIHRMGDRGILNENFKTRSFIVKKDKWAGSGYKVVMIDFAVCNFRKDYADGVDWSDAKAIQDEEGAVGLIMQDRLEDGFAYEAGAHQKSMRCSRVDTDLMLR